MNAMVREKVTARVKLGKELTTLENTVINPPGGGEPQRVLVNERRGLHDRRRLACDDKVPVGR